MKRLSLLILTALLSATFVLPSGHATDEEEENAEGFDCVECTLSRGPAVILEEDVRPAEHMEKFVEKLPVPDSKSPRKKGISRSPAIIDTQEKI